MNKIIKSSKVIYKILQVIFWVLVAALGISAVACVLAIFIEDEAAVGDVLLQLGDYELTLKGEYSSQQLDTMFIVTFVNVLILGTAACYIVKVLQGVFRPMSLGEPFSGTVSSALKRLAFAVLFTGVAGAVLQTITNAVYFTTFDIPSLFAADKVSSCVVAVTADFSFVVWFVIFLLLANVFRYGEQLQRESDETL